MLKIHVWHHKDGDHLVVSNHPWWQDIYEWLVFKLFCPCCGFTGFLSRIGWVFTIFWSITNRLLGLKILFGDEKWKVPVDGCEVSRALWGDKNHMCWNDDCPYWENSSDDAFTCEFDNG